MTMQSSKETLKHKKTILIFLPDKEYLKSITSLVSDFAKTKKNLCYISLNQSSQDLLDIFKENSVDCSKIYFVDAISKTTNTNIKNDEKTIFVSSPESLVELSISINEAMNKFNSEIVIFDSISTLLIYEKESTVSKFIHSLVGKIKHKGANCVLTVLEADSKNSAVKDICLFVDEVLTFSEYSMKSLGIITNSDFKEMSI
ncbi:MAG: hypothetical protein N3D73_01970 [Candidatus Diapherotrites archaeon]|nr:hypothetical protein [Candidatus Diapherotrites archaeon]